MVHCRRITNGNLGMKESCRMCVLYNMLMPNYRGRSMVWNNRAELKLSVLSARLWALYADVKGSADSPTQAELKLDIPYPSFSAWVGRSTCLHTFVRTASSTLYCRARSRTATPSLRATRMAWSSSAEMRCDVWDGLASST